MSDKNSRSRTTAAGNAATKAAGPHETAPKAHAGGDTFLSGGNPRIAKGCGAASVQAYITAMPGWKSKIGQRIDPLVEGTAPGVSRAAKWSAPFYGPEGEDWFLSFPCFTKYVKVTFFRGASLRPLPPGESRHEEMRYFDICKDQLDESQVADWVKQASQLPGERM